MKIRITEDTFWLGHNRKIGEVLDGQVAGPFRTEPGPGGLKRIPQFVEMAEQIQTPNPPQAAAPQPVTPPPVPADAQAAKPAAGTFAEATAAALKSAAPVASTKSAGNPLAARVRALTARRAKFQDVAAGILEQGEEAMTKVEADGPAILQRSVEASNDELAAITDLADSLKDMDRQNS